MVQNRKASEKHYRRIDEVKPKTGVVRLLRLTEKQYNNIYMVTGEPDYQEITVGVNCHIMILWVLKKPIVLLRPIYSMIGCMKYKM